MARKKRRTTAGSHLHDESKSPSPSPSPSASLNPSPEPNPAGVEQTPSGNDVVSISGGREKQEMEPKGKKKERGISSPGPKHLEDECRGIKGNRRKGCRVSDPLPGKLRLLENECHGQGKGLQSDALGVDDEMYIEKSKGNRKKGKKVSGSPQKDPCIWLFGRRALWNVYTRKYGRRRQRRVRFLVQHRVKKIAAKADDNYLETESHGFSSKRHKMDKTATFRTSSVLGDIITEAENNSSKNYHEAADIRLLCRSPIPVEGWWLPSCVETNAADIQPLWRPPSPVEHDCWVPNRVETNGQGRKRLQCRDGDALVEVFDVKVDLSGRAKTHGKVYGNITLDCTAYNTVLFNCNKDSAVVIQEKGSLPLKGSDAAPLGYDTIAILVNLNIDDDKLCEGHIIWNPSYARTDEWLYRTLKGRNGLVHVTYAVMKHAFLAELDVKFLESTKDASSKIYGDIVVYIDNMQYLRYFAFNKGRDEYSIVKPLESIPLSRSLFSCCCGSSLVVKVDLRDSDTKKSLACGALLFPPEYYGDSVETVSGPGGMVQVKVNWVFHIDHSKTRDALRAAGNRFV